MSENNCPSNYLTKVDEITEYQKKRMVSLASKILSSERVTWDDLLQPNDFPLLENNPEFRYEEGVFSGLLMVRVALSEMEKSLGH